VSPIYSALLLSFVCSRLRAGSFERKKKKKINKKWKARCFSPAGSFVSSTAEPLSGWPTRTGWTACPFRVLLPSFRLPSVSRSLSAPCPPRTVSLPSAPVAPPPLCPPPFVPLVGCCPCLCHSCATLLLHASASSDSLSVPSTGRTVSAECCRDGEKWGRGPHVNELGNCGTDWRRRAVRWPTRSVTLHALDQAEPRSHCGPPPLSFPHAEATGPRIERMDDSVRDGRDDKLLLNRTTGRRGWSGTIAHWPTLDLGMMDRSQSNPRHTSAHPSLPLVLLLRVCPEDFRALN
jgi:hypothetical protein